MTFPIVIENPAQLEPVVRDTFSTATPRRPTATPRGRGRAGAPPTPQDTTAIAPATAERADDDAAAIGSAIPRRRSYAWSIRNAASAPPIRPPRWPPTRCSGITKREREVDQDQRPDARLPSGRSRASGEHEGRAHEAEDGAGGADRGGVGLDQQRTERPREQRGEVERPEAPRAERRLEQVPEEPEDVHVEAEVDQAAVEEAAGDQPVALAVGDGAGRRARSRGRSGRRRCPGRRPTSSSRSR